MNIDEVVWTDLTDAYGQATDVPKLLSVLEENPAPVKDCSAEPWFSLWSALCHQGDIYTASYAAVPRIVQIAQNFEGPLDPSFFLLPASIEVARNQGRGPATPKRLVSRYNLAIKLLPECIMRQKKYKWDQTMIQSTTAALAVAKGHYAFAECIMNLDDSIIKRVIDLDFE